MLFESLNYDYDKDKRTCFEYMEQLIDQIYGVESQIIEKANHKISFAGTGPKNFDQPKDQKKAK